MSWKVYQRASDNFGDNALTYFDQFANAAPGSPLYDRGMASVPGTKPTHEAIADAIRADVTAGTLPQVSWIVADAEFSEHPSGGPPGDGHHFVNMGLQALNADPDVFDSTVLFLNYDENDGYFDHVAPPVTITANNYRSGGPWTYRCPRAEVWTTTSTRWRTSRAGTT
ncbi:alkaline phosphatase family protein [Streptomyces sp. NPDC001970]